MGKENLSMLRHYPEWGKLPKLKELMSSLRANES